MSARPVSKEKVYMKQEEMYRPSSKMEEASLYQKIKPQPKKDIEDFIRY
jgi:hypothetical protein